MVQLAQLVARRTDRCRGRTGPKREIQGWETPYSRATSDWATSTTTAVMTERAFDTTNVAPSTYADVLRHLCECPEKQHCTCHQTEKRQMVCHSFTPD